MILPRLGIITIIRISYKPNLCGGFKLFFLKISTPTWGNDPTLTKYISNGLVFHHLRTRFFVFYVWFSSEKFRTERLQVRFRFFDHKSPGQMCPQLGRPERLSSKMVVCLKGGELPISGGSTWKFGFWRMDPEVLGFWFRIFRIDVGWFDRKSWKWS